MYHVCRISPPPLTSCDSLVGWFGQPSPFTVASLHNLLEDFKKSLQFFKTHPLLSTDPQVATAQGHNHDTDSWSRLLTVARQKISTSPDFADLLTNPRFDDPTYLTGLAIALATIFVAMSWFSRSGGGWGGRFSPFGRPGASPNSGQVSDSDFSYITAEDLKKNRPEIVDWDDKNPDRDTDVLIFKYGRTHYPTHFAAFSIRDGELKIGTVRQAAAKKLSIDDPRRIRLFHKGKNLKNDDRTALEEGLRGDGTGSEILCAIGEGAAGGMAPGAEESDGEDDDEAGSGVDSASNTGAKKKSRKRGGRKSKKKSQSANASGNNTPGLAYSNATSTNPEYLPMPSNISGPTRPTSAPSPNASRAPTPQTPLAKLDAIASKFHTEHVPLCVAFLQNPPEEKSKRTFEYKKLSETILTQILMKLDGVETEGDQEARARRKELVKEVNAMLNKLDELNK
ncbi:unnamed protein product [Periconia digitata]|uniref:BAG domain-containing protein n=1 Tax=Periconia digitata TaxID=1303443 RepID=A0A9W4UB68_9PLEO|nr:unnamed protein product [Periconia digitata]